MIFVNSLGTKTIIEGTNHDLTNWQFEHNSVKNIATKKNKNEDEFSLGIKKRPKKKKKLGWVHFRYREISMKSGFH